MAFMPRASHVLQWSLISAFEPVVSENGIVNLRRWQDYFLPAGPFVSQITVKPVFVKLNKVRPVALFKPVIGKYRKIC